MPGLGLGITARRGGLSPAIAASLPSLDLDFLKQGYQMSLIGKAFSEIFTFSRASGGGRINASGVYEWVASNQPRFDYDPVTLQPKGILIEEQRTNLIQNSENIAAASWTKGANLTSNGVSGTLLGIPAYSFTSLGAGNSYVRAAPAVVVGQQYTATYLTDYGAAATRYVRCEGPGTIFLFTLTPVGGGVYLATCTFTVPAGTTAASVHLGPVDSVAGTSFRVTAAQLEAGAFATSYIPTSGSQVTRAVDIPTEQLQPWFKPGVGTVVWRGDVSAVPAGKWQGLFQFDDGSTANRLGAYVYPNGTLGLDRRIAGAMVNIATANSVTPGAQFKVACSWDSVNFYLSLNGGPVVSAAHGGLPTVNRLVHGKFDDYLNGHEAGFKYLPKTTIGAALQALSA